MAAAFQSKQGKPRVILANHLSFLDTIMSVGLFISRDRCGEIKAYANSHVMKMPIIGTLGRACDHLEVVFKSNEDGRFETDKTEMEKSKQQADDWLAAGNILVVFPEGAINKHEST